LEPKLKFCYGILALENNIFNHIILSEMVLSILEGLILIIGDEKNPDDNMSSG